MMDCRCFFGTVISALRSDGVVEDGTGEKKGGKSFMWYVMQVRGGTEHRIIQQCKVMIPTEILEDCFFPLYEERRKVQGKWQTLQKMLFPGYIFMITDHIEKLCDALKSVIGLTKLIGIGDELVPLSENEVRFLLKFGGKEQVVEMSEGVIEGANVQILSGPLMGLEAYIKKIDRHKRKAYLEIEMFGRMQSIQVGLEVAMKTV